MSSNPNSESSPDSFTDYIQKLWKYDLTRNALTGFLVGAIGGFLMPFMKPITGGLFGGALLAAIGIYFNLKNDRPAIVRTGDSIQPTEYVDQNNQPQPQPQPNSDIYAELGRLGELKDRGLISESEFAELKRKLIERKSS